MDDKFYRNLTFYPLNYGDSAAKIGIRPIISLHLIRKSERGQLIF